MRFGGAIGMTIGFALHAGFILFGGLLFFDVHKEKVQVQQVDLIGTESPGSEDNAKNQQPDKAKPESETEPNNEDVGAVGEDAPDAASAIRDMQQAATSGAPALEALSLSAIEAALGGQAGAGGDFDFARGVSFASGGVIGGTGRVGGVGVTNEGEFNLDEIDQKPRVLFQASPNYPAEMRGKKIEGVVSVVFIVDATGKVTRQRVEKSSHPAFEKPALEAVKQWKFEAAMKGGQRVACNMRVSIRFK